MRRRNPAPRLESRDAARQPRSRRRTHAPEQQPGAAPLLWNPGARDHWDVTTTLTASVQYDAAGRDRHCAPAHPLDDDVHHAGQGRLHYRQRRENFNFCRRSALAPNWYWHEHGNLSDTDIVWMTGLDRSLVKLFDAIFFEGFPGKHQEVTAARRRHHTRSSVPPADPRFSSKLVWRSDEIAKALAHGEKLGEANPYDDVIVEFRDPARPARHADLWLRHPEAAAQCSHARAPAHHKRGLSRGERTRPLHHPRQALRLGRG